MRYTVVPGFEAECDINFDPKGDWVRFDDVWPELRQLRARAAQPPASEPRDVRAGTCHIHGDYLGEFCTASKPGQETCFYSSKLGRRVTREEARAAQLTVTDVDRAAQPPSVPHSADHLQRFTDWLMKEMPAGTVIGDPAWWARKLLAAACVFADEAPDSWQPIETAPKDEGFECLIAAPGHYPKRNNCLVGEARLYDQHWYWAQLDPSDGCPVYPTHWMPLPEAPCSTATKEVKREFCPKCSTGVLHNGKCDRCPHSAQGEGA